jgi:hypothetical protein
LTKSTIIDNCSVEDLSVFINYRRKQINEQNGFRLLNISQCHVLPSFTRTIICPTLHRRYVSDAVKHASQNQKLHDTLLLKHETPGNYRIQILYVNIRKLINYIVCQ